MGVRLTSTEGKCALYDSTTGLAFGPVFEDEYEAEGFLVYTDAAYGNDLASMYPSDLMALFTAWRNSEPPEQDHREADGQRMEGGRSVPTSQ